MNLPIVKLEDWLNSTLKDFQDHLISLDKPEAREVTIADLANTPLYPNGVYLFFSSTRDGDCVYVGKASSRSFLGRIPGHFEPRQEFWMNHLSKKYAKNHHNDDYYAGLANALSTFLVLVGVRFEQEPDAEASRRVKINTLEAILRTSMKPKLNERRGNFDDKATLDFLLDASAA